MTCRDVKDFSFLLSRAYLSWLEPCCSIHSCFLQDFCLPALIQNCQLESCNPQQVYNSVMHIARVSAIMRERSQLINEATEQLLLGLIKQFLDYQLEVVGYKILDTLDNLLHLHRNQCQECTLYSQCRWLDSLKDNLMDTSCLSRCRLNALCRLTTHSQAGARLVLSSEFFSELYAQFGKNPALDSGISALICQDICNTCERHLFHVQMVKEQLLSDSLEVRSAIEKRFLLKKLQNAQFRHWFMDNFVELSALPPTSKHSLEANLLLTKMAVTHQKTLSLNLGWSDYMPMKSLLAGLLSNSFDKKLAAWSLLCDHPKTSRPVCLVESSLAKQFVASNLAEQNPSARTQVVDGLRKLLERMRESSRQLFRKKLMEKTDRQVIAQYTHFLVYLLELAFDALAQNSNFNRRISALQILRLMFCSSRGKGGELGQSIIEHFQLSSWLRQDHFKLLLASFDDDYEICQLAALEVATQIKVLHESWDLTCFLRDTKEKMFALKPSSKAQSSIIFRLQFLTSHLFHEIPPLLVQLLNNLSKNCSELESNLPLSLLEISNCTPVYPLMSPVEGILTGIFESNPDWALQEKGAETLLLIVELCFRAAQIVSPVVHSASPEGFLPQEFLQKLEQENDVNNMTIAHNVLAQKLLLACWRTHKAVSSLFTLAMEKFPYPQLLDSGLIKAIGDYFWLQLTECRHVGAFGLAADAFELFCKRLWKITSEADSVNKRVLSPLHWLNQALDALSGKNDKHNLCSTRRSAGLPHLISSVLSTQPKSCSKDASLLHSTLDILLTCRQMVERPEREVHCVNVLKALFSNNTQSDSIGSRMQEAFIVCLQGCSSSVWAVRNAHCQLFSVLVTKAFRSSKSVQRGLHVEQKCKMSSAEFFLIYPRLYPLMHASITSFNNSSNCHLNAFPVLILLTHLYPTLHTDGHTQSILPFIAPLLKIIFFVPLQKLRELGAAALLSITSVFELQKVVEWILKKGKSNRWKAPNFLDSTLTLIHLAEELGLLRHISLAQLCQNVIKDLIKERCVSDLPDMCRASLLSLIFQVGDNETRQAILSNLVPSFQENCEPVLNTWSCSIRPLASLLAKSQCFWLKFKKDANVRRAFYRAVFLKQFCIEDNSILDDLLADFCSLEEEQDLKYIVLLMAREVEHIISSVEHEKLELLNQSIMQRLSAAHFVRNASIKLQLYRILLHLNTCVCSEDCVQFLKTCLQDPHDEIRLEALQVVEKMLRVKQNELLLKIAVLRLKDEEVTIREYASIALKPYIWENGRLTNLNSEISWSLALERWPEVVEAMPNEECDEEAIFEDCQLNPFAESFGIFRFKEDFKSALEAMEDKD